MDFLQGLITNDINLLDRDGSLYSCILTPNGRFLCDFFIVIINDSLYIDIHEGLVEIFRGLVKRYKLRQRIEVAEEDLYVFCTKMDYKEDYITRYEDRRNNNLGFRYISRIRGKLDNSIEYNDILIENLVVDGIYIPQERGIILEHGIDECAICYSKGCYLGQELITRTKRLGEVRKFLYKKPNNEILDSDNIVVKGSNYSILMGKKEI